MTKHTPGPWTIDTRFHVYAILDPTGQEITFQDTEPQEDCGSVTSRGRTAEETQANARLMAAAPELLEALESITASYDRLLKEHGKPFEWGRIQSDAAREAIAKAKGGER